MPTVTVASLKRVSAKALSEKILAEAEQAEPSLAVIDVRDVGEFLSKLSPFFLFHGLHSTSSRSRVIMRMDATSDENMSPKTSKIC